MNAEQTRSRAAFNIFRALRLETHEIRHSNFLGWLLDPQESHDQGEVFLRTFIEAIRKAGIRIPRITIRKNLLRDAQISREIDQLDLRIVLPRPKIVIGIENKL